MQAGHVDGFFETEVKTQNLDQDLGQCRADFWTSTAAQHKFHLFVYFPESIYFAYLFGVPVKANHWAHRGHWPLARLNVIGHCWHQPELVSPVGDAEVVHVVVPDNAQPGRSDQGAETVTKTK